MSDDCETGLRELSFFFTLHTINSHVKRALSAGHSDEFWHTSRICWNPIRNPQWWKLELELPKAGFIWSNATLNIRSSCFLIKLSVLTPLNLNFRYVVQLKMFSCHFCLRSCCNLTFHRETIQNGVNQVNCRWKGFPILYTKFKMSSNLNARIPSRQSK